MRNPDYLAVLAEAVGAVRASMADRRLPELTPEQLAWWFRTATASDIERVMKKERPRNSLEQRAARRLGCRETASCYQEPAGVERCYIERWP
jgi:hypothetical protein